MPDLIITDYESGVFAAVNFFCSMYSLGMLVPLIPMYISKISRFWSSKSLSRRKPEKTCAETFQISVFAWNWNWSSTRKFWGPNRRRSDFMAKPRNRTSFFCLYVKFLEFWPNSFNFMEYVWSVPEIEVNLRARIVNAAHLWGKKSSFFWTVVQKLGEQEQYSRLDLRRISRWEASNVQKQVSRPRWNSYLDEILSLKNYLEGISNICSSFRN